LRLEALNLIDTCLDFVRVNYSYNFAHKLLGIDRTRAVLKDAGQLGQSFTCFHSILSFFDSNADIKEFSEERRLGMKILYKLCVSHYTYETVLRFLRTSYDFIVQYLHSWERMASDSDYNEEMQELILQEMTYFLRILTIDIKITSEQNLKSHCASYVNFLFTETKRGRILDLLSPILFSHSHPVLPNLEFFEQKGLWKAINECSTATKSVDLKALHQRLLNEIRLIGPQLGVIQTNLVRNELKTILSFGAALNESQQKQNIKTKYFDSWRQLLEILIITRSLESCDEESRIRYLMEIIIELINRASDSATSATLLSPISSSVLMISSTLSVSKSQALTSNVSTCLKSILSILDSSSPVVWSDQKITRINFYASLLYLFRSLPFNLFNEFKYNNRLLERLSKDMLSGHEVAKVLSISLLNRTDLSIWLNEISSNGTLRQLLETLLSDDREIRANNFEFIKTFYGFEAKMMLLLQIYSSSNVTHSPINTLDVMSALESIQSFDMYPYLVGQNSVCHKLSEFINCRTTLSDILRMAPNLKNTVEGKEVLVLITKVICRLVSNINKTTQISFIGLLSHYYNDLSTSDDLEIVFNILFGCIQFSRTNALLPLFEPSLSNQDSKLISHQPLGLLVSIINNCCVKSNESLNVLPIVESSLYLLWHHLNLFFSVLNIADERQPEVETLKAESEYILSDVFFSKIQVISQKNTFVDALTVTADTEDNEMVAINDEADVDSGDDKEEVSKLKLKGSYRQKYKRAWELDNELRGRSLSNPYTDWLSPFTGDPYSAFCRTCHSKLHAHKKGLLAHAKSSKHKKHSLNPEEPLNTETGEIPNNSTKALCVACRSVITAGRSELIKHSQAAKHKKAILDGIPEDLGEFDFDWLDPSYVPPTGTTTNVTLTTTPTLAFSANITTQQMNSNNHLMIGWTRHTYRRPEPQLTANITTQQMNSNNHLIETLGMNLTDIIHHLQESVPIHLAEKWDNVGLLTQPTQPLKVHNVLLTIDLTEKVVEEALKKRVNLIISYHPPIFKPLKSLVPNHWKEKIILTCIENKIAIYSPHTALDAIKGGINDWLLTAFGSSQSSPIQQSYSDQVGSGHFSNCLDVLVSEGEDVTQALSGLENVILTVKSNEYGGCDVRVCCDDKTLPKVVDILSQHPVAQLCSRITKLQSPPLPGQGMGRFARLDQPLPLYEIVHRIKQHLDQTHVRLAMSHKHTRDTKVSTIGVCAGSGGSVLANCKADVWITGEMSHHEVLDAIHNGSSVILCEHTNTERGFLKPWSEQLKEVLGQHNVNIMLSDVDKDPLRVV
ncbi:unnamed protein product, partial [Medioppia subpectinata]